MYRLQKGCWQALSRSRVVRRGGRTPPFKPHGRRFLPLLRAQAGENSEGPKPWFSFWGAKSDQNPEPPKQYLYGRDFGMPVVREKLSYSELLRDIRLGLVKEVSWFTTMPAGDHTLEGPCLVIYRDGLVKQSCVPGFDVRIPYAMESQGVTASLVPPTPPSVFEPPPTPPSEMAVNLFSKAIPIISLVAVYLAATYASFLKGDAEDRKKIRRKERADKAQQRLEEKADILAMESTNMAMMGMGVDEICAALDRLKVPYERAEIEREVEAARIKNMQEAQREVSGESVKKIYNTEAAEQAKYNREKTAERKRDEEKDEMAQADEFRKISTVKVQKARNPEQEKVQQKLRAAQRKMKGVKLQYTSDDRVFFDDVAGIGASKEELMEVVDFFLKPERFRQSGARIPRGVLLCGPPGTGKTLLARAVAGEAGVAFLSLNASEFVEMFVGVGASRVRDLFSQARSLSPAIIFIDEIDAVGRVRGGSQGNDERDQTLNQMLSEMDGFDAEEGVIVMAATNRKDVLDPALTRPGRFDRIIFVDKPDFNGRIEIMQVHMNRRSYDDDVDLRELAFETHGSSGAQLANLVNTAAMLAGREDRDSVSQRDLLRALDLERLGPTRETQDVERRRRMAVQEAATSITCTLMPTIEPVVSVSIIPREKYPLGQTVVKVNEARELNQQFTRRYLEEQLLTTLAGRAAEEILYGFEELSTINERRLVLARRIVAKMVVSSAMSDNPAIGPRTLSVPVAVGDKTLVQYVPDRISGYTHEIAESEMYKLLNGGHREAKALLERNRALLDHVVEELMERGQLTGTELEAMVEKYGDPGDLSYMRTELEKMQFSFL